MTGNGEQGLTRRWVAASTHAHKECAAIANLERQGFRAYCPMVRRRIRHARRLQEVMRPLFPGYVFIRLDPEHERWRPILSTVGVRQLVRFGDRLGILPERFVEGLLAREVEGIVPMPRPRDGYDAGEKVRLREGPFDGVIATVLTCDDRERLLVLMDILKRSVRIKVSLDSVVPA